MTHPSARYGVWCPKCTAEHDQPCRTLTTGRVTDTHSARIRKAQRVAETRQMLTNLREIRNDARTVIDRPVMPTLRPPLTCCPGCGEVKFVGHGPLCSDCYGMHTPPERPERGDA
jgi:hypothetical protein